MLVTNETIVESPCRGEVSIKILDLGGKVLHEYQAPNTIVYGARMILAKLLVAADHTTTKISKMKVGTGTTTPTRNNTTLVSDPVVATLTATNTFPTGKPGHVEFQATLGGGEGNSSTLTEVGLFTEDGTTMFARQVHGGIQKTSSIQLQYTWRIIFT